MNTKRILLASVLSIGFTVSSIGLSHADSEPANSIAVKEGTVLDQSTLENLLEVNSKQAETEIAQEKQAAEKKETATPASASEGADKLIAIAKSKIGAPYVYSSSGPNSFDCSGFTSYVYRQMGITLPRVASGQAYGGQRVAKGDLQKGDLVFFNTYGGISHVGIYMENGNFVHASSYGGGVMISNLNDSYYQPRYVTAARYL